MPSKYCRGVEGGRRQRVNTTVSGKSEDSSAPRAAPHLHYLTVRVVSNGQVTIIKHHQVDFRQKQDFPL